MVGLELSKMPGKSQAGTAFESFSSDLRRYLKRRAGGLGEADDIMQEVFARFVRICDAGTAIGDPKALLYAIASNVIRELIASKASDRVMFDSCVVENSTENPLPLPRNDVFDELSTREQLSVVLGRLPALWRDCVLLNKRDGMNFDEIAQALDISPHTAKKYTTLGLAQIRLMQLRRH